MMLKSDGSRSMNIAPESSLRVDIRPDSNEVKNVSGTHVSVCLDVLNLCPPTLRLIISPEPGKYEDAIATSEVGPARQTDRKSVV